MSENLHVTSVETEKQKRKRIFKGKVKLPDGQEVRITTAIQKGAKTLPVMLDKNGNKVDHEKELMSIYLQVAGQTGSETAGVHAINDYIKKVVKIQSPF